jgi:alpha-mannosidase
MRGTPCALGALKVAEDGNGLILRVHEPAGARGPVGIDVPKGWKISGETNLLEDAIDGQSDSIGPFEIRSFRLRPD